MKRLYALFLCVLLASPFYPFAKGLERMLPVLQDLPALESPSVTGDDDPSTEEERLIPGPAGLLLLVVVTAGGAALSSQGSRFQQVNRFIRHGSVED